jgi:GntR family transcriptional regulator, transcriptional repressor for pyruvate dehydrogenase complex
VARTERPDDGPKTLSQQIVDDIRQGLFDGEVQPGDHLGSEASLAEVYGVSRMAARDALRALSALGVVTVKVGKGGGVFVAHGNLELLVEAMALQVRLNDISPAEMMESLMAIEVMSAGLAAERAGPAQLGAIKSAFKKLEASPTSRQAFVRCALDFHEAIVVAASNRSLLMQFQAARQLIQIEYERDLNQERRMSIVKSCQRLVQLIEQGDVDGARQQMFDRLESVRQRAFQSDRRYGKPAGLPA